jgi:hypothetical protein
MVPAAKRALSFEQIDAQTAVELPDRDMMALINIILVDVASGNEVAVQVPVGVAANICGVNVAVLAEFLAANDNQCEGTISQVPVAFRP